MFLNEIIFFITIKMRDLGAGVNTEKATTGGGRDMRMSREHHLRG